MPHLLQPDSCPAVAYLEHFPESGEGAHRLLLDHFPFSIGRSSSAHYCINSRHVSKEHAQIICVGDEIRIRDLGSTNGTFVNGQRIQEAVLSHGDIVHVAHKEFRFGQDTLAPTASAELLLTDHASKPLPASAIQNGELLKELIRRENVLTLFQPIVDLRTQTTMGYECLGRGTHDKLNPNPAYLLSLAAQCNLATELSQLFRRIAVREASSLPAGSRIFFNLHPSELRNDSLLTTLRNVPAELGGRRQVVLEFHEEAVADTNAMRKLRDQLLEMGIGLAYDDFGTGQARLSELADVPPDYVKLDKTLVRGLHLAHPRQELVRALTRVSTDLGIHLIAEGIETMEEAEICLELGCHFGQGYLLGRPEPVAPSTPSCDSGDTIRRPLPLRG
jgi:EAL domain-containing protein (putative c-di-GMP-specific phosphodiesterase class I)